MLECQTGLKSANLCFLFWKTIIKSTYVSNVWVPELIGISFGFCPCEIFIEAFQKEVMQQKRLPSTLHFGILSIMAVTYCQE